MSNQAKPPFWHKIPLLGPGAPTVGVIRLAGVIGTVGVGRKGLTLADMAEPIERAFKIKNVKAVALQVNSPGGSPVQSDLIAGRIRQWADEKNVPVIAFCEDAAASGGYWLATAADEIYVRPSSIVGSIGVVSSGFGFVEAIEKLGVERRVHTAGPNKSRLDPFKPENPEDIERLKEIQSDIHADFIEQVKRRRGGKLTGEEDVLFSGDFWAGRKAVDLGLADGVGELRQLMRERYGDKVRFKPTVRPKGRLQRLLGLGSLIPASLADDALSTAEQRLWWQRLGL